MCVYPGMTTPKYSSASRMRVERRPFAATARRTQAVFAYMRVSSATWSLRDRAVWSRLPASPTLATSARSIAMWMSSSVAADSKCPASISP
jgi:hypothetical protein